MARLRRLPPPPTRSRRIYLRLDRDQIGLFRFMLEARAHLALFTVINPAQGLIMLRFSPGAQAEVEAFLHDVGDLRGLEVLGGPDGFGLARSHGS